MKIKDWFLFVAAGVICLIDVVASIWSFSRGDEGYAIMYLIFAGWMAYIIGTQVTLNKS